MFMHIILFGPPGVGKGTQAKMLSEKYNLTHISTGDILRAEIAKSSELGKKAREIIEAGKLVPDEIMIEIIKNVVSSTKNGFILDGFPRTIVQAESLDKLFNDLKIKIDIVLYIDVDEKEIIRRLENRLSCSVCGKIFNIMIDKIEDMICTNCGGKLTRREDDNPEVIIKRMKIYKDSTEPVKEYYKKKNLLTFIDGSGSIEEVFESIVNKLGQ